MTNAEILAKWAEYSKYDPKRTNFRLGDFWVHKANKTLSGIGKYDSTGNLAVLYAKNLCKQVLLESAPKSYMDIISDPTPFDEAKAVWKMFNNPRVLGIEQAFKSSINEIIDSVTEGRLIGSEKTEISSETLLDTLSSVTESLEKCSLDIYARGEPSGNETKFSTHIHVFETTEDCVLALGNAKDAIYLCYIRLKDSAYGYFGFFVKDGGMVYSVTERIDESYPGEHSRRRTYRDAESKQYQLFPYSFIFDFKGYDYKGYAGKHIINKEELNIFNLGAEAYLPLVVAMYLVKLAYWGKELDGQITYIYSIASKLLASGNNSSTSLVVLNNGALSTTYAKNPLNSFDKDKFISGEYNNIFTERGKKSGYSEWGIFTNEKQYLVDEYGQDFDPSYLSLETLGDKQITIEDKSVAIREAITNTEFIGSATRMELVNYWWARKALAEHLVKNMNAELEAFGGVDGVHKWYESKIRANLYNIVHAIARVYDKENKKDSDRLFATIKDRLELTMGGYPRGHGKDPNVVINKHLPDNRWKLVCAVTKTPVSFCFAVIPRDWSEVAALIGVSENELPKVVKGWVKYAGHSGNSILHMVDPVSMVDHPLAEGNSFYDARPYYGFSIGIGFSKRGFLGVCKDLGIDPIRFWAEQEIG